MCDGFCKQAGISARRTYEANSPATVANLIALGCGVGFWPQHSWGNCGEDTVLLPIEDLPCRRAIFVKHSPNAAPVVHELAAAMRSDFQQLVPEV